MEAGGGQGAGITFHVRWPPVQGTNNEFAMYQLWLSRNWVGKQYCC